MEHVHTFTVYLVPFGIVIFFILINLQTLKNLLKWMDTLTQKRQI